MLPSQRQRVLSSLSPLLNRSTSAFRTTSQLFYHYSEAGRHSQDILVRGEDLHEPSRDVANDCRPSVRRYRLVSAPFAPCFTKTGYTALHSGTGGTTRSRMGSAARAATLSETVFARLKIENGDFNGFRGENRPQRAAERDQLDCQVSDVRL